MQFYTKRTTTIHRWSPLSTGSCCLIILQVCPFSSNGSSSSLINGTTSSSLHAKEESYGRDNSTSAEKTKD
ncbi:unnamed protein product [Linum trigynum]|uniref:Uncharacterized protein n=1 Tax=Linum trigynum TaxID=586398 RepID=A0AAV2FX03_9ROSI